MGKQDIVQKSYFSDNARFADLFNGGMYHGKHVIDAETLNDVNPVLSMVEGDCIIEKSCDQMRKNKFCIWMLENQEFIDYSMPIRVMLKEAMEYDEQRKRIADANRKRWKKEGKPQNAGEYLYRFRKEDKLIPVNSLVLYWGEENWDGATSLRDLLYDRENEHSDEIMEYVADYKIHVFNLNEPHDYSQFETELREVFELYQRRNDVNEFMRYYDSIDKQKITYETVKFLGHITDSKRLLNYVETEQSQSNKEDEAVCLAIEELYQKGCSEGRSEGIELGRSEGEGNFAKLILFLTRDHRMDDIEKVAVDEKYRRKLFHEFGIE